MPRIEHGGLFTEHITPCLAPCDPIDANTLIEIKFIIPLK